jgi:hypothetical protein
MRDSQRDSADADASRDGCMPVADSAWLLDVRLRALARRAHDAPVPSRLQRGIWPVVLLLHLLAVIGLREAMHARPGMHDDQVLYVDLIAPPPDAPALPEPPAMPRAAQTLRAAASSPAPPRAVDATPPAEPRLFNPDGTALVPDDLAAGIARSQPKPDFVPRSYAPSPLLAAKRPLKVRPNHFAAMWAGSDGKSLPDRMWDKVTFVREFRAPWGGRYACAVILILLACGDVPDKPWTPPTTWKPATELDER